MPTAAIIGANRGIGLGLASQYAAAGWRVHATTRTPENPGALGEIRGDVHIHELEVTDRAQQRALGAALTGEAIDMLIHNAGVYGTSMRADAVNRINAEAPIEVAEALMDAVVRSGQKKIALISSQVGARRGSRRSLGKYGNSKAALNDRFRARGEGLAGGGLSRGGHPPRLGTHRHGRRLRHPFGRGERAGYPAGDGGTRRVAPRPILDLGRARASLVVGLGSLAATAGNGRIRCGAGLSGRNHYGAVSLTDAPSSVRWLSEGRRECPGSAGVCLPSADN